MFKAHRPLYLSTLGLRVKKKKRDARPCPQVRPPRPARPTVINSRTPHDMNLQRFQGGLVFKAHRRLYHSTLGLRVIKKRRGRRNETLGPAPKCNRRVLPAPHPPSFEGGSHTIKEDVEVSPTQSRISLSIQRILRLWYEFVNFRHGNKPRIE